MQCFFMNHSYLSICFSLAMHLVVPILSCCLLNFVAGQTAGGKNSDDVINTVFKKLNPDSNRLDINPTEKAPGRGTCECVPYYLCSNGTIIEDDLGIIDIPLGKNNCDHYLNVCCQFPPNGVIPPDVISPPEITPVPPTLPPDQPSFCGIRNSNGIGFKLTGNRDNEAEYGEFPFMLTILKKNPGPDGLPAICGASLIAPNVVLTGAHCVNKTQNVDIKVRAGEWDTQTERERYAYQERDVSQIIIHEAYESKNLFNDVALVILNRSFDKAAHIGTICLPREGVVFNSKNCFATGWGKDLFGRKGRYQVILKKIELSTVPRNQCEDNLRKTRLGPKFVLHQSFICAGGEAGKDTCTGDGGGPLVCPDPSNPKRYLQAGIVAWGIGCGEQNVPRVYVDVSRFRSWIDGHMSRLNLDTAPYNI